MSQPTASDERRLTITELAAAARVSPMTVSRVLNGRPDVAPATRKRVERLIAEHGFVRNRAARAMRKGRNGIIDLVVPTLDTAYILEIIRGVEDGIEPTGFRLAIATSLGGPKRERHELKTLADGSTDGVLLVLALGQSARLEVLRRSGIPFVAIDHHGELGSDVPSVGATNWSGGRAATEYLLSLGHRRIGFIGGPPTLGCTQERLSGYNAALGAAGIDVDPDLVRPGDFLEPTGTAETMALLDQQNPPTAIFASNDMQAVGAYRALRARGRSIPGDMSVIGFDDILVAPLVSPPLSTVRQPLTQMGRVAASMLMNLIDGRALDSTRVELATSLVVRESCAQRHKK